MDGEPPIEQIVEQLSKAVGHFEKALAIFQSVEPDRENWPWPNEPGPRIIIKLAEALDLQTQYNEKYQADYQPDKQPDSPPQPHWEVTGQKAVDTWKLLDELSAGVDQAQAEEQPGGAPWMPKSDIEAKMAMRHMSIATAYQRINQFAEARAEWRLYAVMPPDMLETGERFQILEAFLKSHEPEDIEFTISVYDAMTKEEEFTFGAKARGRAANLRYHSLYIMRLG
jgi:hypothetical protein